MRKDFSLPTIRLTHLTCACIIMYENLLHAKRKSLVNPQMTRSHKNFRANLRLARQLWPGQIQRQQVIALKALCRECQMPLADGDFQLLEGRWYVTHSGLLRVARRTGCSGIRTSLEKHVSDPAVRRWVFKAVVYRRPGSRAFVGFGDADPSNVSPVVRGAEMRVAETRAVNRALRKAYGIGLCSVEELGWPSLASRPSDNHARPSEPRASNGSNNGHTRLRDQLCLLIRKYELDPTLVKRYAADFCGTETLRDASRDLVEAFISTLGEEAAIDRAALVCKLNSYGQAEEAKSS